MQAGRFNNSDGQNGRQDPKLQIMQEAIKYESQQQFSNAQGNKSDFAGFLVSLELIG